MREHELRHTGGDAYHEGLLAIGRKMPQDLLVELYALHQTYGPWDCAAHSRFFACCADVLLEALPLPAAVQGAQDVT